MKEDSARREATDFNEAYRTLVEQSLQGLLIIQAGRAVFANPSIERLTGYARNEILSLSEKALQGLVHPDDRAQFWGRIEGRPGEESLRLSSRFRFQHMDGGIRWVSAHATQIRYRKADAVLISCLDATEEIEAEERASRISRILTTLWRCGELISRITEEQTLTRRACQCIARHAGYSTVWLGSVRTDHTIHLVGHSEYPEDDLPEHWQATKLAEEVARTGILAATRPEEYDGDHACIVLPLTMGEDVDGLLGITSSHAEAFDAEEIKLLTALATDLAYGIQALRTLEQRSQLAAHLSQTRQMYRDLLEHAPCLICQLSPEGETRYVNSYVEQLTGYKANELVGQNWWDTFYPGNARLQVDSLYQAFMDGNISGWEMELVSKDGVTRTISWNSFNRWDEPAHKLIEINGAGVDITARVQGERRLRESEAKYRLLVENQNDLVVRVDRDWAMDFVSPSVGQLFGAPENDFLGRPFETLLGGDPEVLAGLPELLKTPPHTCNHEHRVLTAGGWRWLAWSCKAIFDGEGDFAGAVTVGRDDTARHDAETALEESEDRYRTLFHSAGDAIFIRDLDGPLLEVNRVACDRLGYDREELLGLSLRQTTGPEYAEFVAEKTQEMIDKGQLFLETVQMTKDGRRIPTEINARVIDFRGRQAIMSIARDITDRKKAEEQLEEALSSTIEAFGLATESRDPYTSGHQRRVTVLAVAIAHEMGLSEKTIEGLRAAGLMHDIGKLSIPSEILSKPSRLSEVEFALIKAHPKAGYDILTPVGFPWDVDKMILQHHERMDGSGYPQGLRGDEILIEARILAVADTVEAMATHRPYRPALGIAPALEEITSNARTLYDPDVVQACDHLVEQGHFHFE